MDRFHNIQEYLLCGVKGEVIHDGKFKKKCNKNSMCLGFQSQNTALRPFPFSCNWPVRMNE